MAFGLLGSGRPSVFDDFIRDGRARKGTPDLALARSLVNMAHIHFQFAASISITQENAAPLLSNYYEALREICEAICIKGGLRVYSHEAFTLYLKERLREERIATIFDRLRRLRNGINYYGETIAPEETIAAANDVRQIIALLKQKYLHDIA